MDTRLSSNQSLILTAAEEKLDEWRGLLNQEDRNLRCLENVRFNPLGRRGGQLGFWQSSNLSLEMLCSASALKPKMSEKGANDHQPVELALLWFQRFFKKLSGPLRWEVKVRAKHFCCLRSTVDAQFVYGNGQPAQALPVVWTASDEQRTGAKIGGPVHKRYGNAAWF